MKLSRSYRKPMVKHDPETHMVKHDPEPHMVKHDPEPHMVKHDPEPHMVKHDPEPHMVKQTLSAAKLLPRMIRSLSQYTERDSDEGLL